MPGKSLRMFMTGESPRSLKKITEFNWSGYALYGTREQVNQVFKRSESEATGIYFLLSDINSEMVKMYIGETDNFAQRIKNHERNSEKDWWTHFIVFQSESSFLNKAHVRYLEHKFYQHAVNSTGIELTNSTIPREPVLAEEDLSDLKTFEENILYILEALNLGYFSHTRNLNLSAENLAEYTCTVPNTDYPAHMIRVDESYILKADSYLKLVPRNSFEKRNNGYFNKWREITNSQLVTRLSENVCKLNQDLEFSSPTAAAAMVHAGAVNGLIIWKNTKTSKSIKEELLETEVEQSNAA